MKQVFYSELLDKYFDTAEMCEEEESKYVSYHTSKVVQDDASVSNTRTSLDTEKDRLVRDIDNALNELRSAKEGLAKAKEEYDKVSKELYNKYESDIKSVYAEKVQPMMELVRISREETVNLVKKFNDKFGTYSFTTTPDPLSYFKALCSALM